MYELLLILGSLASIAIVTTLLQFFAPHLQNFHMPAASTDAPLDAEFAGRNLVETYLSYRG
jgi:hypothetical protein